MDVFLIIVACIVGILMLGVNIYLLALYCHSQDKGFGASLFCKILVVLGLSLAWAQVLLMPLDVGLNNNVISGNFNMKMLYYITYMIILAMITILIPFSQFFYETDEDKPFIKRIIEASLYELIILTVSILFLVVGYSFLGKAEIPVETTTRNFSFSDNGSTAIDSTNYQTYIVNEGYYQTILTLPVTFPIFAIGGMAFIGWFLLFLFGGVGLSALPLDMILEFTSRPQAITSKQAAIKRTALKARSKELIAIGEKVKASEIEANATQGSWWEKRKVRKQVETEYKEWKAAVLYLDSEYEIFNLELQYMDTNPLTYYMKFVAGIILAIVSFIWWLQILLFMVLRKDGFPRNPFLNYVFLYFQSTSVSFIGTVMFAFFSIYLLWCCQKGNLALGVRVPFLFSVYPMKVNETWMNSFLFNTNLILMCSVSVAQFSCDAFSMYTRNTEMALIFIGQIRYLSFFKYFFEYKVFEISLLVNKIFLYFFKSWSAIVAIYLILAPPQKPKILQQLEVKVAEKQEIELKTQ